MVDRKQVVFPLRVDDVEHDVTLVGTQSFRAREFFLFLVVCDGLFPDRFFDFVGVHRLEINVRVNRRINRVDAFDLRGVGVDVPIRRA